MRLFKYLGEELKRISQLIMVGFGLFLLQCTKVTDPYSLAPENASSTWTVLNKSTLISSKYCKTHVPSHFDYEKLTLAEVIDIGLRNNPETKRTWSEARAAAATYGQTLSSYYPEINFSGSYTRVRQNFYNTATFIPFYLTTIDPLFSVNYTIFDFGKRKNSSENAKYALYFADYSHNQKIQTIIQTIIANYYSYLFHQESLTAKQADLENTTATLDAARERLNLGLAALGDVAQARSNYLQSKIELTNQKKAVENAYTLLAKNIGIPPNISFKVECMPDKVNTQISIEDVNHLVKKAQENRQDFLAAKSNVKANQAKFKQAKSEGLPTINAMANIGKNYYNQGGFEDYNFTAQVSLDVPLFKGFFFRNGQKIAKANLEKSQAELMDMELKIIKEVSDAHFDVSTSQSNLIDSEEYVVAAEQQFDIALSNYKLGTGTILDVLSSQSSLSDARSRLANAKKDWYVALVNISFATGSLCTPEKSVELEEMTDVYQDKPCNR